jgi:hypothetical protein
MAAIQTKPSPPIPDTLYHIKRVIIDYHEDKSGATRITDILGTFTDLKAAKLAARSGLASEGYLKDDFETFEQKDESKPEEWKYGDGVLVYAKAPAGQEFEVSIDTKPNVNKFVGNASGEVEGHLHYVLQTTINYNNDRIGGIQHTEVEGTYPTRKLAFEAAKVALLDNEVTKESFAEYDLRDDFEGDWPFGEDCWVHAVAENGENSLVFVKAQPKSHKPHVSKRRASKASQAEKMEKEKCDCKHAKDEEGCKHEACKHHDCECRKRQAEAGSSKQ